MMHHNNFEPVPYKQEVDENTGKEKENTQNHKRSGTSFEHFSSTFYLTTLNNSRFLTILQTSDIFSKDGDEI